MEIENIYLLCEALVRRARQDAGLAHQDRLLGRDCNVYPTHTARSCARQYLAFLNNYMETANDPAGDTVALLLMKVANDGI